MIQIHLFEGNSLGREGWILRQVFEKRRHQSLRRHKIVKRSAIEI